MEEGEISGTASTSDTGYPEFYDPAYEWPGSVEDDLILGQSVLEQEGKAKPSRAFRKDQPCFRLLVQQTSILPQKQTLAIVDGYSELQFGRDVSPPGRTVPRIRLKEMQVSKLHATAYWDGARQEWGIVDMGSKHGTFLQQHLSPSGAPGIRLSPPRVASMPRYLHHLDCLTIGTTQFLVHIHEGRRPCAECAPQGGDEIPFFAVPKQVPITTTRTREVSGANEMELMKDSRDPKMALIKLKQNLLTRHQAVSATDSPSQYLDRSARRRAMYNGLNYGVSSYSERSSPVPTPKPPDTGRAVSQPPVALTATNVGHRLLMMQGWEPGQALGIGGSDDETHSNRMALTEPIELKMNANRAGLGSKNTTAISSTADSTDDWRDIAKHRRWDSVK